MSKEECERDALYESPVGSAIGSCLLAVGLYTGTFESVVRLMRVAVQEQIKKTEANDRQRELDNLDRNSNAAAAINFCTPYLLQASVATRGDIEFMHQVRQYRNDLVHEAIDRAFSSPRLMKVSSDIRRMIGIAHAIEKWRRSHWTAPPGGYARIAIYYPGLLESCLQVATELAADNLEENSDKRT